MQLQKLLPQINSSLEITSIQHDSRLVTPGSLFVALSGVEHDGIQFIKQAIECGAVAVVYDQHKQIEKQGNDVVYIPVLSAKNTLHQLIRDYYGNPSEMLSVIGVTGTNGKTTVSYLIENMLSCVQQHCGVVGTIQHRIGTKSLPSKNTTPGILENQQLLQQMLDDGCQACVMEVSSHGLDQGRVDGIDFAGAVFTNLSGDHLDYHGSMEAYYNAKAKLFRGLSAESWAVINVDDMYGLQLSADTPARVVTYGIDNKADMMVEILDHDVGGMRLLMSSVKGQIEFSTAMIGRHNAYNLLATATVGLAMGLSLEEIQMGLEMMTFVPGRLERMDVNQDYHVFIDYAHTHDGLENVLNTLSQIKTGRLITLFGCGGDRDRTKRPKMGSIATSLSDFVIVTSDNPRSENPQSIIDDILTGVKNDNYHVIVDRREAIDYALKIAQPDDIVLITGKGHETYQILHDRTIEFDEKKVIGELLER